MIGCSVGTPEPVVFKGISFIPGPELVFKPSFVAFPFEYPKHFPIPADISISSRSSLVINNGDGLTIESLDLDGALVINCEEGVKQVIKGLKVCNKGWIKEKVSDDSRVDEIIKMRGYRIKKLETRTMTYKADGTIIDSDSAPAISISPKTVEKESPQCLSKLQGPENEDDGTDKCQCTIQ